MSGKDQSPFEKTLRFPWWAGVLLAISSYLLLHRYAVREISPPTDLLQLGHFISRESLVTLAGYGQYILPAAFLAGSILSVFNCPSIRRVLDYGTCRQNKPATMPQPGNNLPHNSQRVSINPVCPKCGNTMALKSLKRDEKVLSQYWGCKNFPQCRAILTYNNGF